MARECHNLLRQVLPLEFREAKVQEFINLEQGSMSVREYSLEFTRWRGMLQLWWLTLDPG